ncbi:MAG: DsrE/DsrF/DrsH-like family protein [Bacillaceae bacterium]|nr:DsrE/DsrF/DrsH-like family protein [Bacillaceae bacterium]
MSEEKQNKTTLIVFSGDLDKAMASFIIATGAAAMGHQVTMFFTFWGLNILRKDQQVPVKKNFMEKMFGKMMPRGPEQLGISKMNFGGMGAKMMKKVMKDKNITTLPQLIEMAKDLDVKFIACQMSMDVLGITEDELIDGIDDFAGVASYLSEASEANTNLFI